MGSTRVWIAMAGAALAVLGGVACSGGDGTARKATAPTAAEAPTPSAAEATPSTVPATAAANEAGTGSEASGVPAAQTPSAEDIQGLVTAMAAQLQQAAASGPDTPAPTSEEIEAQLLEQLRQLGIPL